MAILSTPVFTPHDEAQLLEVPGRRAVAGIA